MFLLLKCCYGSNLSVYPWQRGCFKALPRISSRVRYHQQHFVLRSSRLKRPSSFLKLLPSRNVCGRIPGDRGDVLHASPPIARSS